jgi:hypothetical protein
VLRSCAEACRTRRACAPRSSRTCCAACRDQCCWTTWPSASTARAATRALRLALHLTDAGTTHLVELSHGTLHHGEAGAGADIGPDVVALDWATLAQAADDPSPLTLLRVEGAVTASEQGEKTLRELLELLVAFDLFFPVIEP